ncbi:MAG: hypothetical protein ISS26_01480 [Candidatus Omnitrophica bacterium]|nr:hypothetical protein [Candidatus Omnitrophota bacterium]
MIIFILRRYNDIDHMVPVIYKTAMNKDVPIAALCIEPTYDIASDSRLKFLREKCGVRVDYIYRFYQPSLLHKLVSRMICVSGKNLFTKIYLRFFQKWVYDGIAKPFFFNRRWTEAFYRNKGVTIAVFDYAKLHQSIIGVLMKAARACNVRTIAIPHGLKIWSSESINGDSDNTIKGFHELLPFDHFILSNNLSKDIYYYEGKGMPAEKMRVIGSARYCPEWNRMCREIYPEYRQQRTKNGKKLKVVYFEGGDRFVRSNDMIIRTLKSINNLEFVDMVVQPRTRSGSLSFNEMRGSMNINSAVPAYSLCRWADVVIVGITSVFMEAFCQGKTVIFPKYLHTRPTIFEERKVGWVIDSYDELENALRILRGNPRYRPYSEEDMESFFTEIVEGGVRKRDVLSGYKDFILSLNRRYPEEKKIEYASV